MEVICLIRIHVYGFARIAYMLRFESRATPRTEDTNGISTSLI